MINKDEILIEEFKDTDLWDLIDIVEEYRRDLKKDIEGECYDAMSETLRKTNVINNLIKNIPKEEREGYFLSMADKFCVEYENRNPETTSLIREELIYFRHCFLKDSAFSKCPVDYDMLKRI